MFGVFNDEERAIVSQPEVLSQPFELGFTYTRSTGPVVGRFLTGLKNRQILGNKASDGRVIVPPMEYDPDTAEPLGEFVEVGHEGVVVSWCWVKSPRASHAMAEPFAWAMIKLDGADIPWVQCLKAPSESAVVTGARVRAVWADEPRGYITDVQYFELV
ncbi:MAG: putative OB-fold protein [Halieaceae bacterium]